MGKIGVYGCCGKSWGYMIRGAVMRPVLLPISKDGGSIMAACEVCAPDLSTARLSELAIEAYVASSETMPTQPVDLALGISGEVQLAQPTAVLEAWVKQQHERGAR